MAKQQNDLIAILGGTFDPIHNGHCQIAVAAKAALNATQVYLLPSYQPVHRTAQASTEQRVAMIKAALIDFPGLSISTLESDERRSSYTINTVRKLRQLHPNKSIVFLMGMDAFWQFDSWKDWQKILDYVHLGVIKRPGAAIDLPNSIAEYLQAHRAKKLEALRTNDCGKIFLLDIEGPNISATQLRQRCADCSSLVDWVPKGVAEIIQEQRIYQTRL